jgi:hypothetical protein
MRLRLLCQAAVLTLCLVGFSASESDKVRRLFVPAEQNIPAEKVFQPHLAFPKLDDSRAPDQPGWSNSVAICTCIKDEQPTDLAEWVQYHKCVVPFSWHCLMASGANSEQQA